MTFDPSRSAPVEAESPEIATEPQVSRGDASPQFSPENAVEVEGVLADDPRFSTDTGADFLTLVGENFADNPIAQKVWFAKRRFPELSEEERLSKYKIFPGGEIGYTKGEQDDDGKLIYYREKPESWKSELKDVASWAVIEGPQLAAEMWASLKGGRGGAAAGSPFGAPGRVIGGLGGATTAASSVAAGSETAKQLAGMKWLGDEFHFEEVSDRTRDAAIGEVLGFGLGSVINKVFKGDWLDVIDDDVLKNVEEVQAKAAEYGIELTPAEISNLNSLKGLQRYLMGHPVSADIMGEFFQKRGLVLDDAFSALITEIAQAPSPQAGYSMGVKGIQKKYKSLKDARSEATEELYNKAYNSGVEVDIRGVVEETVKKQHKLSGKAKSAYKTALKDLIETADDGSKVITSDLEKIHNVTQELGDKISAAKKSGKPNLARKLTVLKKQLDNAMYDASPDFKKAQNTYEELSKPINEMDDIFSHAVHDVDRGISDISTTLFGPNSSPEHLLRAKSIMASQEGGEEAFNELVAAYIRSKFNKIAYNAEEGLTPFKVKQAFYKNKYEKDLLEAALPPGQLEQISEFLDVLTIMARQPPMGSPTASNLQYEKMLEKGGPAFARKSWALARDVFDAVTNPLRTIDMIAGGTVNEQYVETLARVFTDPEALKIMQNDLKILKNATEGSARYEGAKISLLLKLAQMQSMYDSDEYKEELAEMPD